MMGNTLKWLVIGGPGTNNRFGITFSPECLHLVSQAADWLVENLLSDVADLILNDRSTTLDEGIAQNMTFTLSHAYQAAALLSAHSGQTVGTTDLAVREDLEVGAVARWAVADARWSDRLKKAPDVGEYFLDSLDEIIRDRAEETVVDSNDDDDDDL